MKRPAPIDRLTGHASADLTRRELARLGLAAPAALALATTLPQRTAVAQTMCVLTPGQTEGPYYFDTGLLRDDLTEGLPGLPLRLELQVVALPDCTPLQGAVVDVWHCAADGRYSGYGAATGAAEARGPGVAPPGGGPTAGGPGAPGGGGTGVPQIAGETFLRGYVQTDGSGTAEVRTIYPGWYTGRTPHIHVKVRLGGETLTSQMYMPDAVTDAIYGMAPYAARPGRDVPTNESDGIYRQTEGRTVLAIAEEGSLFVGRLLLAVQPGVAALGQAAATDGGPGRAGGPPAGPPPGIRFPITGGGSS